MAKVVAAEEASAASAASVAPKHRGGTSGDDDEEEDNSCELPFRIVEILATAQPVAESLFADFDFGEIVPGK